MLPHGFKNSPTLFGHQLAKGLELRNPPREGKLLQYVDDILLAAKTPEERQENTINLLNFLGLQGYRTSRKKAQLVKAKVIYLGYELSAGQRTLGHDRKELICQTPRPQPNKERRTFPGMAGCCRLWTYKYGSLVKPLYALLAADTSASRGMLKQKEPLKSSGKR